MFLVILGYYEVLNTLWKIKINIFQIHLASVMQIQKNQRI